MTDPYAAPEIASALHLVHRDSVAYWQSFDTETFLAPIGTAWSPADNVRHLTKSVRAVSAGLRTSRWILWLAFRSGRGPSRRYAEVRETYRSRLTLGASAGKFSPTPLAPAGDANAERTRIMAHHATAITDMADLVLQWPENALDRRRLPHPLLGPLTVREMLLFTVYHNQHHVDVVRRRLSAE